MATTGQPQPSPELFFDTLNAYQRTECLKGAIELDVFTAIGEGSKTVDAIAKRCRTSERGMRILCDYLVIIGFLTKRGNQYDLTPDSAVFLDRRSPAFLGGALRFLNSPLLTGSFQDIAAIVRKGGTVVTDGGTVAAGNPVWIDFARAMGPMMTMPSEWIAKFVQSDSAPPWKVLDIAAGHGLFGIAIGKHNPNAEIVALDWPQVLEVARENAAKAGIGERYKTIPGSAFDVEFGSGYDLVLLTNFLHHFDRPTCETLLRKVRAALKSGGRAITLEFVPNEDRVSPPTAATFSLMMLGTTPSGDAYTFLELDRMFRNAGFMRNEIHPIPASPQQVLVSFK